MFDDIISKSVKVCDILQEGMYIIYVDKDISIHHRMIFDEIKKIILDTEWWLDLINKDTIIHTRVWKYYKDGQHFIYPFYRGL